jgi:hypothetical protein
MTIENNHEPLDISDPRKSGKILIIGLLITLPLFTWWGSNIKIHPIKIVNLDADGVFKNKKGSRWELNPKEAKYIKNQNGDWVQLNEKRIAEFPVGDYALKWESKNIWALIGLELFQ